MANDMFFGTPASPMPEPARSSQEGQHELPLMLPPPVVPVVVTRPAPRRRRWGWWVLGGIGVVLVLLFVFDRVFNPNGMNPADWRACGQVKALLSRAQAGEITSHARFANEFAGIRADLESSDPHLKRLTEALQIVEDGLRSDDDVAYGIGAGQLQVLCRAGRP